MSNTKNVGSHQRRAKATGAESEMRCVGEQPDCGCDSRWRQIANNLAGALRPYSCFREQRVRDGRIIVETAVPRCTLAAANAALNEFAAQLARESTLKRTSPRWPTANERRGFR